MEIRYFQIIIPIVALIIISLQLLEYSKKKSGVTESILVILFWVSITALSIFPDFFSDLIANVFGIKSNINAVIFLALGLLFFFQLRIFKMIKRQDRTLTELARKMALKEHEK